jgi:hypothetical protein
VGNYCTPEDVALLCNFTDKKGNRAVWGENPKTPSETDVEAFITIAEEYIEDRCQACWGTTFIQVTEMHDFFCDWRECSLHLNHCNVATFDNAEGDKIEAWMGGTIWKDWVVDYQEGRGDDYWVDYKLGKIWFIAAKPPQGVQRLRITYRYNSGSTVPGAIKLACALQVGVLLTNSELVDVLFPEGAGQDMGKNTMVSRWERQIDEQLKRYEVTATPHGADFIPINY